MFNVGDSVVHTAEGICHVEGTEKKTFDGKTDEYYVLKAIGTGHSTVYIPTQTIIHKPNIRLVLTKEQINAIIALIPKQHPISCGSDNERRKRFREILFGGSCEEIAGLIVTIKDMKAQIRRSGKKPKIIDERIIHEVQDAICAEFSYVLGISREQVLDFIEQLTFE